tara:strand:- start:693 stop:1088 length:396 start_codon:yes stop_codon:yes gene_type:complete
MNKIIIYTNKTCSHCKSIKKDFKKENIEFEERIGEDWKSEWQEVVNLTGMPTVPTIEYNNEYFVPGRDFGNGQQLIEMLKNYTDSPHEQYKRVFERLKTLNYNISMAFNRTNQILTQIETKINTNEHKSTN